MTGTLLPVPVPPDRECFRRFGGASAREVWGWERGRVGNVSCEIAYSSPVAICGLFLVGLQTAEPHRFAKGIRHAFVLARAENDPSHNELIAQ